MTADIETLKRWR